MGKGALRAVPTIYHQTTMLNGGHAEPVIGRAFARPVGFAHPTVSLHHLSHSLAAGRGIGVAAEIPGAQRAFAERALDR